MPPPTEELIVVVPPVHANGEPDRVPGHVVELTVTSVVVIAVPQAPVILYEIVTVPAANPVTVPSGDIITPAPPDERLVIQVPPGIEGTKVIAVPTHMTEGPLIVAAVGIRFTVTT